MSSLLGKWFILASVSEVSLDGELAHCLCPQGESDVVEGAWRKRAVQFMAPGSKEEARGQGPLAAH